jgi:hypothetical protein
MIFIRSRGGACMTLAALAMLLASSKIALADTTKLICHMNDNKFWVEEGPTTIELNEAQSTIVAINFSKVHGAPGSGIGGGSVGGRSIGPFPATFTADTITFSIQDASSSTNCTINRLTGVYSCKVSVNGNSYDQGTSWTCHAAQKQF